MESAAFNTFSLENWADGPNSTPGGGCDPDGCFSCNFDTIPKNINAEHETPLNPKKKLDPFFDQFWAILDQIAPKLLTGQWPYL